MSKLKASTAMRRLVRRDTIFIRPGCHDVLSARMAAATGFEAIGMSGYAVSVSLLAQPDVGLITMNETMWMYRYICNAVDIPVIVDADTGYGGVDNVMRTVDEVIKAGAGGLFIEDQVDPKRCGHVAGKQLISIGEGAAKIRAADKVRRELDEDFVIMARTDGRGALGRSFQESLDRARAFTDAGADIIFPEGLVSVEEIGAWSPRPMSPSVTTVPASRPCWAWRIWSASGCAWWPMPPAPSRPRPGLSSTTRWTMRQTMRPMMRAKSAPPARILI